MEEDRNEPDILEEDAENLNIDPLLEVEIDRMGILANQLNVIEEKIDALTTCVASISTIIMANTEMLINMSKKISPQISQETSPPISSPIEIFPIRDLKSLHSIDHVIASIPEEEVMRQLKRVLSNRHISHAVRYMFSDEVILKVNWNGVKNVIALNKFKLFKSMLFEAVKSESYGYSHYVDDMKIGIKRCKVRLYKNKCISNKKKPE